jgi:hypothetical protein
MTKRPHMKIAASLCLAFAVAFSSGCASSVSVPEWQASLEQFAADYANHDMSFLREDGPSSSRREFSIIGTATPEKSTDINGVVLGRRTIANRQWLVFLIGRVKHREVTDIQLALRSDDSHDPTWLYSRNNNDAVREYRANRENAWRSQHRDRKDAPLHAFEFPAEDDVFQLNVTENEAVAVHENSGASWRVKIPRK